MDNDEEDEYEDEVIELQQKSDQPTETDDVVPSGLGRVCNLSMIMEQSFSDLELTVYCDKGVDSM